MRISVIGTGYVGLVTGVCFVEKGHTVTCVDVDRAKVDRINAGEPPIYENGLEALLGKNVGTRLRATTDLHGAVLNSELSLIAVGTPFDGIEIDLSFVKEAARQIGAALKHKDAYHVVVVKSTVVPGTTEDVVKPAVEEASGKFAGKDFGLGMNPEFLREGEAVADFMDPDRIVLGGIDERTLYTLGKLYAVFPSTTKVLTTPRTAEMIKYTSNALLATLISFSNEIGNLCSALGDIDVVDVMNAVHLDKRLMPVLPDGSRLRPSFTTYLEAGCGFGGSCFPKDVRALIAHGLAAGAPMQVLGAVMHVNERQPMQVLRLLHKHFESLHGVRIAVLGLAFKPGTDDVRESPALALIRALCEAGARVIAYDPVARHEAEKVLDGAITYGDELEHTIADAQAIVVMTRWPEFEKLPDQLATMNSAPLLVDGRRMLDKQRVARYEGIGT